MLRDAKFPQSGRSGLQSSVQLSDRVVHLFRTGHLARAAQEANLEEMCRRLDMPRDKVLRYYGRPQLPATPKSVVYLVGPLAPAYGEPVKIGYTRSLPNRIEQLQPGSVKKLWLLAYREGGLELEREVHERLIAWQIREDWFEMCEAVREEFSLPDRETERS